MVAVWCVSQVQLVVFCWCKFKKKFLRTAQVQGNFEISVLLCFTLSFESMIFNDNLAWNWNLVIKLNRKKYVICLIRSLIDYLFWKADPRTKGMQDPNLTAVKADPFGFPIYESPDSERSTNRSISVTLSSSPKSVRDVSFCIPLCARRIHSRTSFVPSTKQCNKNVSGELLALPSIIFANYLGFILFFSFS